MNTQKALRAHIGASKAFSTMNLYDQQLVCKPDIISDLCVFCGRPATEKHHIIPRSHGGVRLSPLFSVCGQGNTSGCHGLLHSGRIHIRYNDKQGSYEVLRTSEPVSIDKAHQQDGWTPMTDRAGK